MDKSLYNLRVKLDKSLKNLHVKNFAVTKKIKMDELRNLQWTLHWSTGKTEKLAENQITGTGIEIQAYAHHANMLRYMLKSTDFFQTPNILDVVAKAIKKPNRVHQRISPNSSHFLQSWVLTAISEPSAFAKAVSVYFTENPKNLQIFSIVTFPSLFHNFISEELTANAAKFLEGIFNVADISMFSQFFASFILSNHNFTKNLWGAYSDLELKTKPKTDSDYMTIFIQAVESSSFLMSKYNLSIIDLFYQRQPEKMVASFIQDIIIPSFLDYFHTNDKINEEHPLIKNLVFAATNPTHSRFNLIFSALHPETPCYLLPHRIFCYDSRTCIVLTSHECLLIQKIILSDEKLIKFQISEKLKLPDKLDNDFEPLFFEVSISKSIPTNDVPVSRLMFEKLQKKKMKASDEFNRYWNMANTRLLSPIDIYDDGDDAKQLRSIMPKEHILHDPAFIEYFCANCMDRIIECEDFFEHNIDLLDAASKLEILRSNYEGYFMAHMCNVWHTLFSNEVLLGPTFVVKKQAKRRNSFSSTNISAEKLPQPPIIKKAIECPLKDIQHIVTSNDSVLNVTPAILKVATTQVEDQNDINEKMHHLLTKVVMPSARLCIYIKCLDDNENNDIEKLENLKDRVKKSIRSQKFEAQIEDEPFAALMLKFLTNDTLTVINKIMKYKSHLETFKIALESINRMRFGSAAYSLISFAKIVRKFISNFIHVDDHYFDAICEAFISAIIIDSENYAIIGKYLCAFKLWNTYRDFLDLCEAENDGISSIFEISIFSILSIVGQDVSTIASDFAHGKLQKTQNHAENNQKV